MWSTLAILLLASLAIIAASLLVARIIERRRERQAVPRRVVDGAARVDWRIAGRKR